MADRDGGHAKRVLTLTAAALLATAAMALGQGTGATDLGRSDRARS